MNQNATYGPEKLIGDTLRENPDNLISHLQEVKAKLTTGKYAFAYVSFSCIFISRISSVQLIKYAIYDDVKNLKYKKVSILPQHAD